MKSTIGFPAIALCLLAVFGFLTSPAKAQQHERNATSQKTSVQAQSVPATASVSQSSDQPIVFPITGKGTANFLPVFIGTTKVGNSIVSQTGNGINVSGTVNAVAITGDGSALTNVPAVQLGGLPASAFAQQGASNNFTADQTITGNLNLTGYINSAFSLQGNLTDQNGQQGANVLGGFPGNAAFGGNSIAPGTIGATIGGGGGAYDPSLLPKHPAQKKPALRAARAGMQGLGNPFLKRSPLRGNTEGSSEPEAEQAPPPGLISGGNSVTTNPITPCCPDWSTIAGGLRNTASGFASSVGGGYANTASGDYSIIAGGDGNTASGSEATVAGGTGNTASVAGSTVSGGSANTANGYLGFSTVAGGNQNTASGSWSFIGGGQLNIAGASPDFGVGYSTVGGGGSNVASGDVSTIAGGAGNTASGQYSAVPGGSVNVAAGDMSFAAGCQATANNYGSFVWSSALGPAIEYQCNTVQDTGPGQFVAASWGGFYFYTSTSGASGSGATLPAGSGAWSNLSDRNAKKNFLAIDPSSLLEKLAAMPVATWNYKTQDDSIRHLGPTAQDFHAAFGLGEDDKHISTVDAEGVALAGIQALYAEMKSKLDEMNSKFVEMQREKDQQITELRERLSHVEQSAGTR